MSVMVVVFGTYNIYTYYIGSCVSDMVVVFGNMKVIE